METGECWLDLYKRPDGTLGRIDHWKNVHLEAIKTKLKELKWDGSIKNDKDKSSTILEVFFDPAKVSGDKTEVGILFKGKLQRKIHSLGKEISETERAEVSIAGQTDIPANERQEIRKGLKQRWQVVGSPTIFGWTQS